MIVDPDDIQNQDDEYWYDNLRGMLSMLAQIIRFYGHDEDLLKEKVGEFVWKLTEFNLPKRTHEDGKPEKCGTFPKFKGEPSISHLIAEAFPRELPEGLDTE